MALAFIFAGGFPGAAKADVAVKPPFASSMVLQRNHTNPVWGTAAPGERVSVSIGKQLHSDTAAPSGTWSITLSPMAEAGPLTMIIKGNNTVTLGDIYVGEVWQAAGQSNMDTRMDYYPNLADSIRGADFPKMRFYTLRQPGQATTWLPVSPATVGKLSAAGYFFGREIHKATGVAVGLVVTAVGGTTVESWLDPASLAENPSINTKDKGENWNAWVASVAGYGMRGTVWIQGEQNCTSAGAPAYADRFKLLIRGWRKAWGQGDFPFYFGQLSSTSGTPEPGNQSFVAQVREGQRQALALPNTAMSVQMDIGTGNWHFPDKPASGFRLSLPAKALLYGKSGLAYSGPMLSSFALDGNRVLLEFSHVGSGLVAKGPLTGFAVAAASGDWVWGEARIDGNSVIVTSPAIAKPARVRYAWSDKPAFSLYNQEGLPASPFTTESPIPVSLAPTRWVNEAISKREPGRAIPAVFAGFDPLGRRTGSGSVMRVKITAPQRRSGEHAL